MRETEKFRTEHLVAWPWQIEDLPLAMELWGDSAVTALIVALGITWVLDGLEVTVAGSIAGA